MWKVGKVRLKIRSNADRTFHQENPWLPLQLFLLSNWPIWLPSCALKLGHLG
jgi:hypothetical protein